MSCFVRKLEDIQFAVIEKERNQYFSSTWQLLLCYMILFIPPLSSPEVFNLIRSCQSWRGCLLLIGPWEHTFSFTVWQLFSMTLLTLWVCVCVCVRVCMGVTTQTGSVPSCWTDRQWRFCVFPFACSSYFVSDEWQNIHTRSWTFHIIL